MITIAGDNALRSVINEAGRQASFYNARRDVQLTELWSNIEALAFAAKQQRKPLSLILGNSMENPTIIKGGE